MPITKRIQYRYDSVRNKIGMTDADGGLHTYTYDVMRRLTGVINPLGERTTYAYDLNGRRISVQLANGTRTSYVYDLGSRVQMVHTLKSDDSTVSKFEYEYDGNGRRTSVLEADGSRVTWTYDRISQVTSEWRTGTNPHRHTFTYDKVGNRTLKIEDGARTTLVYDACNQLLTSEDTGGTTTFTYDGNGNQSVVQKPNGDRTTQVWDYENRLVKTIQPSGGVTSMAYDADGLRLKLEEPTGTKLFVWDDQNYLAETDAAGATETAFTTEPSTYGGLISHRKAGASTTYHYDALGSTRALTDESEAVLERYNYSAFGTLLGSPTLLTPFLWGGMVGYYWDAALASQYIRARHYQPSIARWISLDPIGFAGGDANLFRYVGNSPTSVLDQSGLYPGLATHGDWIFPPESAQLIASIQSQSDDSFDRMLSILPQNLVIGGFRYSHFRNHVSYLRTLYRSSQYLNQIGTGPNNKFVFTCKWGWLDHGHFLNNAAILYLVSFTRAYFDPPSGLGGLQQLAIRSRNMTWLASFINEIGQEVARSNSAWSLEDLISNMLGRQMGIAQVMHEFPRIRIAMSGLEVRGIQIAEPNAALTRGGFYDIGRHWNQLLIESGAVLDSDVKVGGKTPRQWLADHVRDITNDGVPPLAGSVVEALSIYHNMELWRCLCDGDRPRKIEHRYVG